MKNTYRIVVPALVLAAPLFAEWQTVADFDTVIPDSRLVYKIEWEVGTGDFNVPSHPYASYLDADSSSVGGTGDALWIDPGPVSNQNDMRWWFPLPGDGMAIDSVSTLKFDFWMAGTSHDVVIGLTDTNPEPHPTRDIPGQDLWAIGPDSWNNYEAIIRMFTPLNVRQGGGYANVDFSMNLQTWYTIYMVNDGFTQSTAYYIKERDSSAAPTLLNISSGDPMWGNWRRQAGNKLTHFHLSTTNYNLSTVDFWWIDNIQIDYTGVNAEVGANPFAGPGPFADYDVMDGYIDTGDWMGVIEVSSYPWIYSFDLASWLYVGSENGTDGIWSYVAR